MEENLDTLGGFEGALRVGDWLKLRVTLRVRVRVDWGERESVADPPALGVPGRAETERVADPLALGVPGKTETVSVPVPHGLTVTPALLGVWVRVRVGVTAEEGELLGLGVRE